MLALEPAAVAQGPVVVVFAGAAVLVEFGIGFAKATAAAGFLVDRSPQHFVHFVAGLNEQNQRPG